MRHLIACAAAALAGVLIAQPAAAEATASVRLQQFSYTLIDLNPGDGVAPSLTLSGWSWLSVSGKDEASTPDQSFNEWIPSATADELHYGFDNGRVTVNADMSRFGQVADAGLSLGTSARSVAGATAFGHAESDVQLRFVLGAYTAVIFSAQLELQGSTSADSDYLAETSNAFARIELNPDNYGFAVKQEYLFDLDNSAAPGSVDQHRTMLLTQTTDDTPKWGMLLLSTGASSAVTPGPLAVPEPSAVWLFAAGGMFLAGMRNIRSKHGEQA